MWNGALDFLLADKRWDTSLQLQINEALNVMFWRPCLSSHWDYTLDCHVHYSSRSYVCTIWTYCRKHCLQDHRETWGTGSANKPASLLRKQKDLTPSSPLIFSLNRTLGKTLNPTKRAQGDIKQHWQRVPDRKGLIPHLWHMPQMHFERKKTVCIMLEEWSQAQMT